MRDRSKFFFIHTYKNMGTTIEQQLPESYILRFWGRKTIKQWEILNNEKVINNSFGIDLVSIDHINIDNLYEMNIIDDEDVRNRKFVGLVRNPIERFMSMCYFENKTVEDFLYKTEHIQRLKSQYYSFSTKHNIDLTLILMEEKELIKMWFSKFNVNLNLDIKKNVSEKKIITLTEQELEKIKDIFEKDFILYDKLKKSSGILENVNITQI